MNKSEDFPVSDLSLAICPYCNQVAHKEGFIAHMYGCEGLQDVLLNRLQYDAIATRAVVSKDLLEALRKIVTEGDYTAPEGMTEIARAAIAKATGAK
jgi:hypothetical protein